MSDKNRDVHRTFRNSLRAGDGRPKASLIPSIPNARKVVCVLQSLHFQCVGLLGIEPRLYEPESYVMPLYHSPKERKKEFSQKKETFFILPNTFFSFLPRLFFVGVRFFLEHVCGEFEDLPC